MSLCIGLTGGIGSGKSAVSSFFARHGAQIVDTDTIAHQLTAPHGEAIPAIERIFGAAFITEQGAMNRQAMRALIYSDPQAKQQLEHVIHPMIAEHALRQLDNAAATDYSLLVVPLFVETGRWFARTQALVVVDCPEQMQIDRVLQRNPGQLDVATVNTIMLTQATRVQRLAKADFVVSNTTTLARLEQRVLQLHTRFMHQAQSMAATIIT